MPGLDLSNVVLPDDLRQTLISRVESGQFASQEALIEEALRSFLIGKSAQESPEEGRPTEPQPKRLPSPFILDE